MNEVRRQNQVEFTATNLEFPETLFTDLGQLALEAEDEKNYDRETSEPHEDASPDTEDENAPELTTDSGDSGLEPPIDIPGSGTAETPEEPEDARVELQEIFDILDVKHGPKKDHVVDVIGIVAARGTPDEDLTTNEIARVFDPDSTTKDGRYRMNYLLLNKMENAGLIEFDIGAIETEGRPADRIVATEDLQRHIDNNPKLQTSKRFYEIGKEAGLESRDEILRFLIDNYQEPRNQSDQ